MKLVMVALGGAAGSVGRYLMTMGAHRLLGDSFPYGTLAVNAVGCFAIGLLTTAVLPPNVPQHPLRLLLVTGFLGGFTTFSALGIETFSLFEKNQPLYGALNVAANLLLGMVAVVGGWMLGRMLNPA